MIQLRTFGSIDLSGADRPAAGAVLAQPKRFALLVYLAVAAPRAFVRRDTLLALFWPETNQGRGRSVLRQTVYLLRQSLGAGVIMSRGDEELGVDPSLLQCDVALFEAALAAGRTAEGLDHYRGDFLAGFHVADAAPELDEWIQAHTRRLRSLATTGARSLAAAEEEAGNSVGAAHWSRRAMTLDPLNEHGLAEAMRLLGRVGDRAGALQEYEEYSRRAEADLGIQPEASTQQLAQSLRATPAPAVAIARANPSAVMMAVDEAVDLPSPGAVHATDAPRRRGRRRWRGLIWGVPAILTITIGAFVVRRSATEAATTRIADVASGSPAARRLFDRGLEAYYREDASGAYHLFAAALAADTSFAMAAYYAGISAPAIAPNASAGLLVRATRLAAGATDRERLLVLHRVAEIGMSSSASAFADTLAARYPRDPDAQFALGHALERRGEFLLAAQRYRWVIATETQNLTRRARCLACEAYERLCWSYMLADSTRAAERVAREFAAARPSGNAALQLIAMTLARQGRTSEAWRAWRAVDSLHAGGVNPDVFAAGLAIRDGEFAAADDRLRRLIREGNRNLRDEGAWYLVLSLRAQGRFREALPLAAGVATGVARPIVLFEMGRAREAADAFAAQVGGPGGDFPGHVARHQAWLLTHLATSLAAAGDSARLPVLADSVERLGKLSAFGRDGTLHHYIRGLLWNARSQPERAADAFRQSVWSWSEGYTRANYELARALIAMKQPAQAVYPLQAALRGDIESSNLYLTRTDIHELLARAFDLLSQRDSAATHYQHVVNAWRSADPVLAARRNAALRRLGELKTN